jgi:hypothetical protein
MRFVLHGSHRVRAPAGEAHARIEPALVLRQRRDLLAGRPTSGKEAPCLCRHVFRLRQSAAGACAGTSRRALSSRPPWAGADERIGEVEVGRRRHWRTIVADRAIVPARTCFHGRTRLSAQPSAVSLCADLEHLEAPRGRQPWGRPLGRACRAERASSEARG